MNQSIPLAVSCEELRYLQDMVTTRLATDSQLKRLVPWDGTLKNEMASLKRLKLKVDRLLNEARCVNEAQG
jgi:hypothetical protein